MNIPDSIADILKSKHNLIVKESHSVSGGSINSALKLSTNRGDFFLKLNARTPPDFFEKEAEGLNLLKSANSDLHIPEVIAVGNPDHDKPAFLLMEFIEEGRSGDSFAFGANLAKLHQNHSDQFGLENDNYIGSLPQRNTRHKDWASFFSDERVKPQLEMAINSGKLNSGLKSNWDRLSAKLNDLMPPTKPSLIHGDLWSGNYLFNTLGEAVLIDPAVYYGHPEMDLAFSKMFGGFSADFYRGYESVAPLEPGFEERVAVYNLYPLLVHVNLFGGHYTTQAIQLLNKF